MSRPISNDEAAFWAFAVTSNIWSAAGHYLVGVIWGLFAVLILLSNRRARSKEADHA